MASLSACACSHSVDQTRALAAALGSVVDPDAVICLDGDLGAGKTHFTQGIAAGLGVSEGITSPTFTIMEAHESGRLPLYHFDLYRLDDPLQLEDIAFYETLESGGVCCIEWAARFPDELPDERIDLTLSVLSETDRRIEAHATGVEAVRILKGWINQTSEQDAHLWEVLS